MQLVVNGASLTTGKTIQSEGICNAWGLSATHRVGRRKSLQDIFQLMVSVFGQGGPILISDVHQWKNKVVLLMSVTSWHVLACVRERKIDNFFFSFWKNFEVFSWKVHRENAFFWVFTFLEQSNNQKGRKHVLSFSFFKVFCHSLTADSTVGQKQCWRN